MGKTKNCILFFVFITFYEQVLMLEKDKLHKKNYTFKHNTLQKDINFEYYFLNPDYYSNFSIADNITFLNSYNTTTFEDNSYYFILKKNSLNYSLNDGYYLDYQQSQHIENPKHIQFSFFIDEVFDSENFEGCNIRLTNTTLDSLISNRFRTNYSDPIFFRIKNNYSIALNDQSIYLNGQFNFMNGFNQIDLFMNWDTKTILMLYNKNALDSSLEVREKFIEFYHINLMKNHTKPNKILLYNLYPNSSCYIKNFLLCENFCDSESELIYKNLTSISYFVRLNFWKIFFAFFILFLG